MDNTRLTSMGWSPKIKLAEGLKAVYNEVVNNDF